MNDRLQSELNRLYRAPASPADAVRALVLELAGPPSWEELSRVWYGVQAELELPAPAIAVSGTDGLQLWFSLAEPVTPARALGFLQRLQARFLPDVASKRLRLLPTAAATVPALHEATGNWSAFVAPDLAPIFGDAPWLDIPPNEEGQANLLRGIETMSSAAFEAALDKLAPPAPSAPAAPVHPAAASAGNEAQRFLLQVMHDDSVPLALRIEAAKALLSG